MTHGLARASCLFMFAALAACGGEAVDDTGDVEQTTIEAAETHLVVTVDDMAPETGHLLGWNIGRGTWYAPADDPLHPQWRTPELAAAVARLSEIRPGYGGAPYVRFSGLQIDGVLGADGYHFWPLVDPARDVDEDDNMAPFEYFALMDEIGGDAPAPVVMLNFGSGTAAEAGDYVTHLNGEDADDPLVAARQHWGREAPYDVEVFELGNEVHAIWNTGYRDDGAYAYANPEAVNGGDPPWYGRPAADPADYAARALEYVNAVRSRSPDARLWVPLSMASMDAWGDGLEPALAALDPLLREPAVEGVVIHHYHVDDAEALGLEDVNDPQFIVAGAELYRPGFARLRALLEAIERPTPLQIVVSEYHVAGFFAGDRFERGEQAIVGLGVADMMMLYAQEGVAHACQHLALNFDASGELLFETWYNPLRVDGEGGVFEAPTYQVNALIGPRLYGRMAALSAEQEARASTPVGAETLEYPVINAVAFVGESELFGSVLLLNRDLEAARELTIDLPPGATVAGVDAFAPDRWDRPTSEGPIPRSALEWTQSVDRVALTLPPHSLAALVWDREPAE
ncbi:MAG: hypothetical protein KC468_16060 [Myxococcales bacterium]|nr:hypothetical protein [Myxococcales bacterium]